MIQFYKIALNHATTFWYLCTLIGQWAFAVYVVLYHGALIFSKGLKGMGATHMPNGYIPGDHAGNLILAVHLITAVVVIGGGPLQLIPVIRKKHPKFHRKLGRIYFIFALFGAIGGLFLVWTRPRPSFGSIYQDIAISIEAVLIVLFGLLAFYYAVKRKFNFHQVWTLRLFLVASGVWFLRIGYKAWYFIEAVFGFKIAHFFDYWSFGSFVIPLAVFEYYRKTLQRGIKTEQCIMTLLLFSLTLIMCLGIYLAIVEMWLPRIVQK